MAEEEKKEEVAASETPAPAPESAVKEVAAVEAEPAPPVDPNATLDDTIEKVKVRRAKGSKNVTHGVVHVRSSFNNTQICITDLQGNVISWSSSGKAGFRGSRKSTAYAASVVAQDAARTAMSHGLSEAEVRVQGPGAGRESAVRAIQSCGINVSVIRDVTPVPHNGCRPRKRRRV